MWKNVSNLIFCFEVLVNLTGYEEGEGTYIKNQELTILPLY